MPHRYWPLFDLRITTPDLVLRPLREDDLATLAAIVPDDLELDPDATSFDVGDDAVDRGIVVHQAYWRGYGTWRIAAWRLTFAVLLDDELVGTQELEGSDFPRLRTVDTSSFLVPAARGRGYGKQMRRGVLACAFGPMAANAAITSAWHDNAASLGVSRALGYRPNGEALHRRGDGTDLMVHMRLRREDWIATGCGNDVSITGFDPCRHLFGLGAG